MNKEKYIFFENEIESRRHANIYDLLFRVWAFGPIVILYGAQTSVNIKNWLVKINPKYSYKGMKNFIQNFILFCMFITQLKLFHN